MEDYTDIEERFIGLLLSSKETVQKWTKEKNLGLERFSDIHKHILSGIEYAANNEVQLTRDSYKDFLSAYKKLAPQDLVAEMVIYNRCLTNGAKPDDFPILLKKIQDTYIHKKTVNILTEHKKNIEKFGHLSANRTIIDKLSDLELQSKDHKVKFLEIHQAKQSFMDALYDRRNNPEVRLTCGIPEIDDTMNVGFKPGHLTLFCADVNSFKTTIMINVALNIFELSKQEANILYIPCEMSADEILQKIVSRETKIPGMLIEHAHKLSEDQISIISGEIDKWTGLNNRFAIMEAVDRPSVSFIRKEIERRINYFKPRVVFIDYIDNLIPEKANNRSDLEMNDTLEDLRRMGTTLGFSVVSAAQLGRDALKKLRESKEKDQSLGSTDIRGGQVMAANSDSVYAQWRNPSNPNAELMFSCIKSRHGPKTFSNNRDKTILSVKPEIGLITSPLVLDWKTANPEQQKKIMEEISNVPPMSVITNVPQDEAPF